MTSGLTRFSALGVALALGLALPALAQTAPSPAPAETAPPAGPPAAAPAVPPAGQPAAGQARPTLVPDSAEEVAEVTLTPKPAAIISGTSGSEEGFKTLREAFRKLEDELAKAGIPPAGRPVAIFQQFNPDGSFNYDALIPIAGAPDGRTLLTNEIKLGETPAGKALRFTHSGAYDEVEQTYDMIEVYLEAKGIVVKDPIIEEFVTDPKDAADAELKLNIFVQPK